jgi:hypothetical protein
MRAAEEKTPLVTGLTSVLRPARLYARSSDISQAFSMYFLIDSAGECN